MGHLRGIFVSVTDLAIMYEVTFVVVCILVEVSKYVGYLCPFSIIAGSYLCCNVRRGMI